MSAATPLRLELSRCPALAVAIFLAHGAAAACLLLILPGAAGVLAGVLFLTLGVVTARERALLRGPRGARTIEIDAAGHARLVRSDGQAVPARPLRGIGVSRGWVVLRLGAPARGGFLVSAGMLQSEPFRLLRLWALWERSPVARGQLQG